MILDFFVNLWRQTSTIILPLGITYSMRDLISDVNVREPRLLNIGYIMQMM